MTTERTPVALGSNDQLGFTVGQEVTVAKPIYEPADDCHPGGTLVRPGEKLIVRAVRASGVWPISVSHKYRTDGLTFSVSPDELRAYSVPVTCLDDADLTHL